MTRDGKSVENKSTNMARDQQQAIMEALSRQPTAYNEEARRVLGSPLGYVEGRALTQPKIVASIMTAGSLQDQ
jgi:hypothetical protein